MTSNDNNNTCSVCFEEFTTHLPFERHRACLASCQHLICRECVNEIKKHKIGFKQCKIENSTANLPRCPVCQESFHVAFFNNAQGPDVNRTKDWEKEVSAKDLVTFYKKIWMEHKKLGYETLGLHKIKNVDPKFLDDDAKVISGLLERLEKAIEEHHDDDHEDAAEGSDNWTALIKEFSFLYDAYVFRFLPKGKVDMALRRKFLHKLYFEPLEEETKRLKTDANKREVLRLFAIRKEREEAENQHQESRKRLTSSNSDKKKAKTSSKANNSATKKKSSTSKTTKKVKNAEDEDDEELTSSTKKPASFWSKRLKQEQEKFRQLQEKEAQDRKEREEEQKKQREADRANDPPGPWIDLGMTRSEYIMRTVVQIAHDLEGFSQDLVNFQRDLIEATADEMDNLLADDDDDDDENSDHQDGAEENVDWDDFMRQMRDAINGDGGSDDDDDE